MIVHGYFQPRLNRDFNVTNVTVKRGEWHENGIILTEKGKKTKNILAVHRKVRTFGAEK
jgi:hypothetical protein